MKCFLVWLKVVCRYLYFFGNTCDNVYICFSSLLLFYHDLTGHGFIALGLCQIQQQWVTQGVVFFGGIFEGNE